MFDKTLESYRLDEISYAFTEWATENREMPTPSDIIKIIHRRRPKQRNYFTAGPEEFSAHKRQPRAAVSWAFKTWGEMDQRERDELVTQIKTDLAAKGDYWKYARDFKKLPADLLQECGVRGNV